MKKRLGIAVAVLGLVSACAETGSPSFIALDSCEFLIPEGYFVSSASVRSTGVTLRRRFGVDSEFGSVNIVHGLLGEPDGTDTDGFQLKLVQENLTDHFRYLTLAAHMPGVDEPSELVRVETDAYTINVVGHALLIWKDHLICPARLYADAD